MDIRKPLKYLNSTNRNFECRKKNLRMNLAERSLVPLMVVVKKGLAGYRIVHSNRYEYQVVYLGTETPLNYCDVLAPRVSQTAHGSQLLT